MKSLMTKMGIGQDRANMEGGHNDKHRNKQSLQTQPAYHISGKQEASVYDVRDMNHGKDIIVFVTSVPKGPCSHRILVLYVSLFTILL